MINCQEVTIIKRHQIPLTILYLLFFLALLIGYNRSPELQSSIDHTTANLIYQGQLGVAKLTGQKPPKQPANSANQQGQTNNTTNTSNADNVQTRSNGGGRWPVRHATVYVAITNTTLRQATIEAIHAWNKTGAFTFHQTKSKKNANVIVKESMAEDGAAGLTRSELNSATGYFIKVRISLNGNYLLNPVYNYSHDRIVNTAEHELGHAVGLEHTNSASVMQPSGSFYSIQPADVQAVRFIYSHKPSTDNSNTGAYNQNSSSTNSNFNGQNKQLNGQ